MPVLRDTAGSESMSSRHMCSMKVSAIAAWSCWEWIMSFDFDMAATVSAGNVLRRQQTNIVLHAAWYLYHQLSTITGYPDLMDSYCFITCISSNSWINFKYAHTASYPNRLCNTATTTTVCLNAHPHIPARVHVQLRSTGRWCWHRSQQLGWQKIEPVL